MPLRVAAFLLLAASAFAQSAPQQESGQPQGVLPVDCKEVENAAGCASFNEMLQKGDPDIVRLVGAKGDAFACFPGDGQDQFTTVLMYRSPAFVKSKMGRSSAYGAIAYRRYTNGMSERSQYFEGSWTRHIYDDEASFGTRSDPLHKDVSATADDTEITLQYSFKNLSNTRTDFTFQIRRSTLRYVETIEAPESSKPGAKQNHFTTEGRCVQVSKAIPG